MKAHYKLPLKKASLLMASVAVALLPLLAKADPVEQFYDVTNLISNLPGVAANQDSNLTNPWGFVFDPDGNLFVADNGSSLVTFYLPDGTFLDYSILANSDPSGLIYNPETNDFLISEGTKTGPAKLLIATEDGTILGFDISVDLFTAQVAVDNSASGAVYKGIALATVSGHQFLYATDFHNDKVDVFDDTFAPLGSFTDTGIPAGFAPFNIRNIGGWLYVTFAKQLGPDNHDDQAGPGNGFVDIFSPNGTLARRLVAHGSLNSPWGLALAPDNFGLFSGALLVGNFGDGHINAYDPLNGRFLGQLAGASEQPITIDGLWALNFEPSSIGDEGRDPDWNGDLHSGGNGDDKRETNSPALLYFSSGPNGETNGLVGAITPETGTRPHFRHGHGDLGCLQ